MLREAVEDFIDEAISGNSRNGVDLCQVRYLPDMLRRMALSLSLCSVW